MKYLTLTLPGVSGPPINFTGPKDVPSGGGIGPLDLASIISTAFELAILVAIIACLIMLIWGGFDWMVSEGDKQKVAKARQRLTMAVIGLVVVFMSFMIINIIYGFFFGGVVDFLGKIH